MDLITLVLLLALVGVGLYLLPMDPKIKNIIYVIVVVVVLLWLLNVFTSHGLQSIPNPRIGR